MEGTVPSAPVIFIPNQRQKPYMGTIVQGLLTKAPVNTASFDRRNIQAKRSTVTVCRPIVGVNAIKMPVANANASLRGESLSVNKPLMRSFTYFICFSAASLPFVRPVGFPENDRTLREAGHASLLHGRSVLRACLLLSPRSHAGGGAGS